MQFEEGVLEFAFAENWVILDKRKKISGIYWFDIITNI